MKLERKLARRLLHAVRTNDVPQRTFTHSMSLRYRCSTHKKAAYRYISLKTVWNTHQRGFAFIRSGAQTWNMSIPFVAPLKSTIRADTRHRNLLVAHQEPPNGRRIA